jgi:hypothetical protein
MSLEEMVQAYAEGESIDSLAKKNREHFNKTRAKLVAAGVRIRTGSEAQKLDWQKKKQEGTTAGWMQDISNKYLRMRF